MLHFRQIDPARNRARFYSLDLVPTLFGEIVLIRRWGRIGTAGQQSETPVPSRDAGLAALIRAARRRRRRGYRLAPRGPNRRDGAG